MFNQNQSYQALTFQQQVIALSQTYPCPRCNCGVMEPYGHTETFKCNSCERSFVPLRGGRMLNPANRMGSKVAPTFWWDGLRWHWAGTTATANQVLAIVAAFLMPIVMLHLATTFMWHDRPEWCSPLLLTALVGLMTVQFIYLLCWDFDLGPRRRARRH